MTATLAIAGLAVEFPTARGRFRALDVGALTLAPGEVLGLVGESGSGKSTLALACLDLVPPPGRVTGSVRIDGVEMLAASGGGGARRDVAMIFQNPAVALSPLFTIGRQLGDIVSRRRGLTAKEAEAECLAALDSVHLPNPDRQWRKYPHQLSGGQLQRVMIALARACRPKLLIADEPTTALDVTIQAQIVALLRGLADDGLAILFITHDLGVAAALCDRVAVLYAGGIVEEAPVETLFASPRHPYTASLIAAVPVLGAARGAVLEGIAGAPPGPDDDRAGCAFAPRCGFVQPVCRQDAPALATIGGRAVACHNPIAATP